ncbi:Conserved Binding of eIF4E 1 [Hibiscus trionum]|uniref:Conserved Binding of eIF4E 1 n=1 Tax=Hibiscus trionum TaxID=183268 RepID=A0A9W7LM94_HIBTR|nr:Conserved Binding of eIF4E 1 [Hibiscus trionum]
MSLENDRHLLDQPVEFSKESQKKSRISYTREFLLSLSELDACKKLPSGFDQSILSEFGDTSQDRQRIPGTLSGYRRNEYGTSPPTGGDSGNYSRGIHGRWDTRPSGRIDRDSDSQSDRDSDPGRRLGNQSRWQGPERDGLLGSGSFPRQSGYRAGASAPKFRANDQYHLNRTTEPYHPPRPYKAAPHSRRETNDSFNDETFGSTECTNEDRAEEERKRRASFESWRKEALQEKKINPERPKGDFDISELLVDSKDDKGLPNTSKELEEPMPASNFDFDNSSRPSQTPASRPLVPPGFAGSILERQLGTKTSNHSHPSQVGSPGIEGSLTDAKGILLVNGTSDGDLLGKHSKQHVEKTLHEQQLESTSIHLLADNKSGKALNIAPASDKSNERLSVDSQLYKSSGISETFEVPGSTTVTEPESKNFLVDKLLTKTNQDGRSTSILDKLFGSALTPNEGGSSNFTEHNDNKPDEILAPDTFHSSKFAHLFLEEDNKKSTDDLSTGRPKDLLSLIQGGEKGVPIVSDEVVTTHVTPNYPFHIPRLADGHVVSNLTSLGIENSEQSCNTNDVNKPTAVPAVLTCEDLEKSILSESIENDQVLPPAIEGCKIADAQTEKQEVNVDDHASQHLLSLLQNKTSMKSVKSSTSLDIKSSERIQNIETSVDSAPRDPIEVNAENASSSGKSLTLETLFGSAFMKELQSVGAPASNNRGSMDSARVDVLESNRLPLHVTDDSVLPSTVHVGSNRTTFETNILPLSQREQIRSDGIEEHFLGYNDARSAAGSSHLRAELGPRLGNLDRSAEIQLPEEDILIGGSNPRQLHNFVAGNVKAGQFPSQETPVDVAEKLVALKGVFRDERAVVGRQEGPSFLPGLYDMREPDLLFHNRNVQPSSPQLHPQLNHGGSLIHSLDSHPSNINPLMKFMAQEGIVRHDAAPNHQFPASMIRPPFHHPSSGPTGFDPPMHHPMLQRMPMPGNFPPPHLQQGFPRGAPLPPHMDIQEVNPMHGFPFGHGQRQPQPNFAGPGMPPGHDAGSGSRHPDALQRFIDMQLRSNSKQTSPFGEARNSQGMYDQGHGHNPELDMGFGYR